ncbi:MAG: hypothetical protein MJA28_06000 [Gammaproteobacteria bacterium]|nr:hypothetical protein [Gammaproteobacteria bacterium]
MTKDQLCPAEISETELKQVPFDLLMFDERNDMLIVYDRHTKEHLSLNPVDFTERYQSFLQRVLNIPNIPVRTLAINGGVIFYINKGLGGFSKEELLYLPWHQLFAKGARIVVTNAISKAKERQSAVFVAPVETRSGYEIPYNTFMLCAQETLMAFMAVTDENEVPPTESAND